MNNFLNFVVVTLKIKHPRRKEKQVSAKQHDRMLQNKMTKPVYFCVINIF